MTLFCKTSTPVVNESDRAVSFPQQKARALPFALVGPDADEVDSTTTNKEGRPMDTLLLWVGRLAGLGGVLVCVWAIYNRIGGSFNAGGFQVGTLLQAGMAAILVGCLCLLVVLTNRPPR
jgi:hypothetical protein